ncbi:T9SS type B sorting domain-containing protein [Lacihabitans lacunae]|uniref:Gliding motility-associated C-terminal domain-containing protein n=1 Tax=Lacihabitans lacunae TaxID=1028214 RepID=A0ABV7Z514_9BACT
MKRYISFILTFYLLNTHALAMNPSNVIKIDLALEGSYTRLLAGQTSFTVKLKNQGGILANNIKIKDILPPNFQIQNVNVSKGLYSVVKNTIIWEISTIEATQPEHSITITGTLSAASNFAYNQAEITQVSEEDIDSTPNNQNPCEDDISFTTIGERIDRCPTFGSPIHVTAIQGFTTYTWYKNGQSITGANTKEFTINSDGNYTFKATFSSSDKSCTYLSLDSVQVTTIPPTEFQTQVIPPSCGLANGSITFTITKGIEPILLSKDSLTFTTENSFQNLAAGEQTIFLKDAKSCITKKTIDLKSATTNILVTSTILCDTSETALLTLSVSGGQAPYQFNDGSGFASQNVFQKTTGTHNFEIKDALGCRSTYSTLVNCQKICKDTTFSFCADASIKQEVEIPTGYKDLEWYKNDTLIIGAVNQKLTIEEVGKYTFKSRKQNENSTAIKTSGCIYNVVKTAPIDFEIAIRNVQCPGTEKGSIKINNPTGLAPFLFRINNDAYKSNSDFNALESGAYTLTVRDSGGCEKKRLNQIVDIDKPTAPKIVTDKHQICYTDKATLTATGCEGGEILWSNNESNQRVIKVGQGGYAAKCIYTCGESLFSDSIHIELTNEKTPIISVARSISCNGEKVKLTASGCNSSIIWNTNENTSTIEVNTSGTYTVTCLNTCENTQESITIQINVLPEPVAPIIKTNTLILSANEKATLSASACNVGGIKWNTGDTLSIIKVGAGSYYAWCANQCKESKKSNQIEIQAEKVETPPTVSSSKNNVCGDDTLILVATGCNGNVVVWSNGEKGEKITVKPLFSTTYSAVCLNSDSTFSLTSNQLVIEVKRPQTPILSCVKNRICEGDLVQIIAENCIGEVVWSTGQKGATIALQPKVNTAYTAVCLQGTCKSQTSDTLCIEVGSPNPPFIYCNKNTLCIGDTLTLVAKDCPQKVVWSNGKEGSSISIKANKAGEFSYTATCNAEAGNCTSDISNTIKITVGEAPIAPNISPTLKNICPFKTVDLNRAIVGAPTVSTSRFEFHTSSMPSSPLVGSLSTVTSGSYYLFEKTKEGCFSAASKVNVSLDSCKTAVDIKLTKTADTNRVALGEYVTYHILVENLGETTATNVIIRDTLPAGLEIYLISPDATYANKTVYALIPVLKYKESKIITFQAKVMAPGKITNTASLWMVDQPDSKIQNNSSSFTINDEIPLSIIGLSKELISVKEIENNIFDLLFKFKIANTGNQKISNLQLVDQLDVTFDTAVNILGSTTAAFTNSPLTLNPNFTGKAPHINLLIDSLSSLNRGDTASILLKVRIDLSNTENSLFFNTAKVFSTSDDNVYDYSTEGNNPDPDNNGNPKDNTAPTKIEINRSQAFSGIATALSIVDTARIDDYTFRVDYMVLVKNRTPDILQKINIIDSLQAFFPAGVEFSVVYPPLVSKSSSLVPNVSFDGKHNVDITTAASFIKPEKIDTVFFAVIIKHKNIKGPYNNQVIATAQNVENIMFSDRSNDGAQIIVFKNDTTSFFIPIEQIYLGDLLIVPEGFSPNNDGKNDTFKIQLLADAQLEYINLFNRWGAKVFSSEGNNIDMQIQGWGGEANTGIGITPNSGVPDGTYYYEIKLKGINALKLGFITIAR